jgi:uncharacterized membrane protein (Fun14 family)
MSAEAFPSISATIGEGFIGGLFLGYALRKIVKAKSRFLTYSHTLSFRGFVTSGHTDRLPALVLCQRLLTHSLDQQEWLQSAASATWDPAEQCHQG